MASLSKNIRARMARALVEHRFKDEGAALIAESVALFNAVLDKRYDGAVAKAMAAFEKAVPDGLDRTNSVYVNAGGYRVTIGTATVARVSGIETPPTFNAQAAYRSILRKDNNNTLSVDGELGERIKVYATACEKIRAEMATACREALSALEQFGTPKRLAEGWPEAMPVIGHLIPENDRALPVVQVAELNSKFDLPPDEKLAA